MPERLRIAVISHEIDDFADSSYLLTRVAEVWKARGVEMAVIQGPGDALPEADLAILHTDITVVDEEYGRIVDYYPRVINGAVRDTSKRSFSKLLVDRDDDWAGPVIVKTDMNFGGMREMRQRFLQGDMTSTIDIQRPWRRVAWMEDYPVFDSLAKVPTGVWRNPALVVEKFIPERNAAGQFQLRAWVFLGDRELYYALPSENPVVKGGNALRRDFLDTADLPPSLREARAQLGFDYGKFDFGLVDGEVMLYDVNRTPGFPPTVDETAAVSQGIEMLSNGLYSFVEADGPRHD